jgi:hypothetical protein
MAAFCRASIGSSLATKPTHRKRLQPHVPTLVTSENLLKNVRRILAQISSFQALSTIADSWNGYSEITA